jgi:hypothetical protein
MLVINFAQDLNIWKDILLPLFLAFIGLIPVAWIGVQSLKKQDSHFAQQIEMQRKIALFTERTKFKDKILEKIDELYELFFDFSATLGDKNITDFIVLHDLVMKEFEYREYNISHLVMTPPNTSPKDSKTSPQEKANYKALALAFFVKTFNTNNEDILSQIKDESKWRVLSLSNVFTNHKADFNNLSVMVEEVLAYLKKISEIMIYNGNFQDKSFQDKIKDVRGYYDKNLHHEFNTKPQILKEIRRIKEKVQDTFVKNISLEL